MGDPTGVIIGIIATGVIIGIIAGVITLVFTWPSNPDPTNVIIGIIAGVITLVFMLHRCTQG